MKRVVVALVFTCVFAAMNMASSVGAFSSVKVTPLEYRAKLEPSERKKGFIDVSNPSFEKVIVKTSVQGFRQIDNKGTLEFFNNEQIRAGLKVDLDEFELGPREAVRMFFEIDGTKLPSGDVYGAIFFTGRPNEELPGVTPTVRVGTLFSVINGTPGSRQAEVTSVKTSFLQLGRITGSYTIKNTANPRTTTGFFPTVNASLAPTSQKQSLVSSLVFAGRERENRINIEPQWPGFQRLRIAYGDSYKDTFIFVVTPLLIGVMVVVLISLIASGIFWRRTHRKRQRRRRSRR